MTESSLPTDRELPQWLILPFWAACTVAWISAPLPILLIVLFGDDVFGHGRADPYGFDTVAGYGPCCGVVFGSPLVMLGFFGRSTRAAACSLLYGAIGLFALTGPVASLTESSLHTGTLRILACMLLLGYPVTALRRAMGYPKPLADVPRGPETPQGDARRYAIAFLLVWGFGPFTVLCSKILGGVGLDWVRTWLLLMLAFLMTGVCLSAQGRWPFGRASVLLNFFWLVPIAYAGWVWLPLWSKPNRELAGEVVVWIWASFALWIPLAVTREWRHPPASGV